MLLAGVDGCRLGWVVAQCRTTEPTIGFQLCATFADVLDLSADIVAVDIPIGLPDSGPRECDRCARQRLGFPRCCSVFSAPIRPVLTARSWAEANSIRHRIEAKGLSRQAWGIVGKIREVDEELSGWRERRSWVFEVHPELCFWKMAGECAMEFRKKARAGRMERVKHLRRSVAGFAETEGTISRHAKQLRAEADDVIDALAALWTAERIAKNYAVRIPETDETDPTGIPMRIWI